MNKYLSISLAMVAMIFFSCTNGQNQTDKTSLRATEFATKIKETPSAIVVDVRTPDEFSKGHLVNARNINWNGDDFDTQVAGLDTSKPLFVYCLSGARSASAAARLRSLGFKVYELEGGIMKWRGANLPETTDDKVLSPGMTRQQFDELINSDKLVLIDFYADWCAPCKKMKPYLEEIAKDMADKVVVVGINADDNSAICKELKIDGLPVVQIYKNKTLTWTNVGFIEKADVLKHLQ